MEPSFRITQTLLTLWKDSWRCNLCGYYDVSLSVTSQRTKGVDYDKKLRLVFEPLKKITKVSRSTETPVLFQKYRKTFRLSNQFSSQKSTVVRRECREVPPRSSRTKKLRSSPNFCGNQYQSLLLSTTVWRETYENGHCIPSRYWQTDSTDRQSTSNLRWIDCEARHVWRSQFHRNLFPRRAQ